MNNDSVIETNNNQTLNALGDNTLNAQDFNEFRDLLNGEQQFYQQMGLSFISDMVNETV
ncbi:MAG: hypothetical protein HWE13_08140 [Gammaproteobacteria bacterium]|nr:hypothetical protein [Gammaproteobacteria bacterium]NVK88082.1 hypothetical protein [Gammaproteobacteria bacterium]